MNVTHVLEAYLSSNRGPAADDPAARVRPDYVVVAKLTGELLEVRLTFRRGAAYCCFESGCHHGLTAARRWDDLRRHLASAGVSAPARFRLRLTGVVEAGALMFDFARSVPGRRGVYELAPAEPYEYQVDTAESPGWQ